MGGKTMAAMPKSSEMSHRMRSGAWTALPEGSGQPLAKTAEAWCAAVTECQREMADFISIRLERDSGVVRDMMSCKSPTDAAAVHSRWVEQTLRDYNSEIKRLMSIYTSSIKGLGEPKE
jgi:hypothetical protein